jgi:hypothetical protein
VDADHWLLSRLLNQVGGCPIGQLSCHSVGAASFMPASDIPEQPSL